MSESTISNTDRKAIYAAYDRIKEEQRGLSAVSIGRLSRESGVDLGKVQAFLLSEARAGNNHRVDLHSSTLLWAKLSEEDRSGAMLVAYGPEPVVTATIRERVTSGDDVPEQKEFTARDRDVMREIKRQVGGSRSRATTTLQGIVKPILRENCPASIADRRPTGLYLGLGVMQ